jgi:hypothetical protein
VPQQQYRYKQYCDEEFLFIKKYINENWDIEFIKLSIGSTLANIIFLREPNGSYRLCLDYRQLNNVARDAIYPIPNIEGIFRKLEGC